MQKIQSFFEKSKLKYNLNYSSYTNKISCKFKKKKMKEKKHLDLRSPFFQSKNKEHFHSQTH